MKLLYLFLFTVLLLDSSFSIRSQTYCDSSLLSLSNHEHAYMARDNRCEGFFQSQVSAPQIEVIGLVQGFFGYDLIINEQIKIYSNVDFPNYNIHLRVNSIPLNMYYQLDCIMASDDTLIWPLNDVVFPNDIQANDLTVIGELFLKNNTVLVPLRTAPSLFHINQDNKVRVFARASIDFDRVYYKYIHNNVESEFIRIETNGMAGKEFIAVIPEGIKGAIKLLITGKIAGSDDDWKEITEIIYIPE